MTNSGEVTGSEAEHYLWTFRAARLEYLPDSDITGWRFPLWPALVEGPGLENIDVYPQRVRRVSNAVSARTNEILESSFDALTGQFILDYQRLKPPIEEAEFRIIMTNAGALALFDTLVDSSDCQVFTAEKWASECLGKLDETGFRKLIHSDAGNLEEVVQTYALALVKHLTNPDTAPSSDEVLRYRDRWFSIKTARILGIEIEHLRPLLVLDKASMSQQTVIVPVPATDLYVENGEVILSMLDECLPEPNMYLRAETPILPDMVQQIEGAVSINVPNVYVAENPQHRIVNYGSDQLILRSLE